MGLKHLLRKNFQILLLLGAILLFFTTPLRNLLNQEILSVWLQRLGIWAVPLFISTYVLVTVLGLPITIHTLTGGVAFGLGWGSLWSTLAATLGAVGAFCLTRYLFRDWATAKFAQNKLLEKWHKALERNPFSLVLSLRFAPIAPFNIIAIAIKIRT
ncbi:TVP38/TMEM64 family protein [Nostoc sp. 'Peltigera membranacea cyanobiont' 232]|uniref:TVP38/TMEM64 family protein n=1 Tax=Nostoc sp. 'Peltigera membranacea cyanobiont' 232 TaxID=2014531 RepID=UPI001CB99FD3|nr:VTT domain-containing protein [Nostoc sp. 'Peltigera membranacea cyanobiont' 232]